MNQKRISALARWQKRDQTVNTHLERVKDDYTHLIYKARLLGFIAGDGSISLHTEVNGKTHHTISFYPDHESLIQPYQEAFKARYLVTPRVNNLGTYFRLRVSCRPAANDLLRQGLLTSTAWRVPLGFLETKGQKREWLRAYFDCEGHVGARVIQVQSVSGEGLRMVRNLLDEFGIHSGISTYRRKQPKWNLNYILSICDFESRTLFLKKIGFYHAEKRRRLIRTLKNAKRFKGKRMPLRVAQIA